MTWQKRLFRYPRSDRSSSKMSRNECVAIAGWKLAIVPWKKKRGRRGTPDERRNLSWKKGTRGSDDYPKFIGPLHELVSLLSHALETSGRSYSGRATRFLLDRARRFLLARATNVPPSDRECSSRIMGCACDELRGLRGPSSSSSSTSSSFFFPCPRLSYDHRLREHCVTAGIIPALFSPRGTEGVTRFRTERTVTRAIYSKQVSFKKILDTLRLEH